MYVPFEVRRAEEYKARRKYELNRCLKTRKEMISRCASAPDLASADKISAIGSNYGNHSRPASSTTFNRARSFTRTHALNTRNTRRRHEVEVFQMIRDEFNKKISATQDRNQRKWKAQRERKLLRKVRSRTKQCARNKTSSDVTRAPVPCSVHACERCTDRNERVENRKAVERLKKKCISKTTQYPAKVSEKLSCDKRHGRRSKKSSATL
eukprot:488051_1